MKDSKEEHKAQIMMANQIASSSQVSTVERTPLDLDHNKDVVVEERRSRPSSPKTLLGKSDKNKIESLSSSGVDQQSDIFASSSSTTSTTSSTTSYSTNSCEASENGRERLKRLRVEMAGRVWIPDIWGQEDFLKDWIDCSAFDACLGPNGLVSARASLVEEGRRATSGGLRIENRC